MRGHGRRGLLALALAVAALAAGPAACTAAGDAAPGPSPTAGGATPSPAPARPLVTMAEAGRALKEILSADGVLGAAAPRLPADQNNLLRQSRDGHLALAQAAFESAENTGEAPPRHTWGEPRLLVPRLEGGAAWFAAVVDRRDASGGTYPVILTLSRQGEDDWQISSLSRLEEELPQIALDADGYATALGDDDPAVQISPRLMAPLHATTAEEGAAGFAAGLIADGPHTSAHASEIVTERLKEKKKCVGYDSIFAAANYPVRALRTADGGALIAYSLIRTTTRVVKDRCAPFVRVPEEALGLASAPYALAELRVVETHQYVSTVPAKDSSRTARIVGYTGGITRVIITPDLEAPS
ncbi:hypothetical protein GCM10010156_42910 [Planobispora rosea]|uniref:DUF8094 domain-containing protein n=1 Tax=Planobispora rosea TaxID=35762 RepID=A0A8J3S6H9_PLARO|nr:hypothetical protein [Planobispora rosea]GGS79596.1 hypothetical protein GCM10010156_42910 [Planobispora rosea]GIH85854.1 hypothetical protein Pro02_42620 [Planobispora rosea]